MSKVAVITGASHRLGAELARYFARMEFHVVVHVNASVAQGQSVVREIEEQDGKALLVAADLTTDRGIDHLVRSSLDLSGHVDLLINNASYFAYDFPGAASQEIIDTSLKLHVLAPFRLLEGFAGHASQDRPLDVFNILDQKLERFNPDYYSYTIGKAGLYGLTKLWQASGHRSVRVFGILPGNMYPSGRQTVEEFQIAAKANLLQRAPDPKDICEAIAFFVNHPSIDGQNLPVDAGERLAGRDRDPAYDPNLVDR
jgi:NAD(P)-dependent dehydrogenase (short-subunit alcohol dehydrogenase family)